MTLWPPDADQGGGGSWRPSWGCGGFDCDSSLSLTQDGLHRIEPGFLIAEEIPDDVDVGWLIAEFSDNAEAIATVVDVEQVIKDATL